MCFFGQKNTSSRRPSRHEGGENGQNLPYVSTKFFPPFCIGEQRKHGEKFANLEKLGEEHYGVPLEDDYATALSTDVGNAVYNLRQHAFPIQNIFFSAQVDAPEVQNTERFEKLSLKLAFQESKVLNALNEGDNFEIAAFFEKYKGKIEQMSGTGAAKVTYHSGEKVFSICGSNQIVLIIYLTPGCLKYTMEVNSTAADNTFQALTVSEERDYALVLGCEFCLWVPTHVLNHEIIDPLLRFMREGGYEKQFFEFETKAKDTSFSNLCKSASVIDTLLNKAGSRLSIYARTILVLVQQRLFTRFIANGHASFIQEHIEFT